MPWSSFCSTSSTSMARRSARRRYVIERSASGLLSYTGPPLQFCDHQIGRGPEFYARVCEMSLEGIISKRADAPYSPGDRGLWVKV
jgi:bifunctional non-homologous end joining protein LigD